MVMRIIDTELHEIAYYETGFDLSDDRQKISQIRLDDFFLVSFEGVEVEHIMIITSERRYCGIAEATYTPIPILKILNDNCIGFFVEL